MKFTYFLLLLAYSIMISCGNKSSGPSFDLKGYTVESLGGGASYAEFKDQNKWLLSTGYVIDGVRNGTWTTYHPNSNKIKTITNYINGKKNGSEISMNDRGSVEKVIGYRNDQLHGLSASYKNGRPVTETTFANGVRNGVFSIYDENNGKIQRRGSFKNGLQHGELLYYDQNGNVTLRYEYSDGEKVSGGIVDK